MCEHNFKFGNIICGTFTGGCILCGSNQELKGEFMYLGDFQDSKFSGHILKVLGSEVFCTCGEKIIKVLVNCGNNTPIDVTQEFLSLPVRSRE